MKPILIAFILLPTILGQKPQPRAIAKFCVNGVFHVKQVVKAGEMNGRLGCQKMTMTRIDENYYHVYGVEVFIGE